MGDLLNKNRAMYQPTKKEVLLQARFLTSQQAQQSIRDYVQEVRSLSASNSVIPIPKCGKADHDCMEQIAGSSGPKVRRIAEED